MSKEESKPEYYDKYIKLFDLVKNNDLETIKNEFTEKELHYIVHHKICNVLYNIEEYDKCKECVEYIGSLCNYDYNQISLYNLINFCDDIKYIDYIIDKFKLENSLEHYFINDSKYIIAQLCDHNNKFIYILKKYIWKEI